MKLKIILYLFLIPLNLVAQPGDHGASLRRFAELTEKLKTDANNYELIWQRITVSRFHDRHFDMYTKSGSHLDRRHSFFKNFNELLDDLNKLIDNSVVNKNYNIAKLKLLRGRVYYFLGETDKALEDYLAALNTPFKSSRVNDKILISIAAYYYNLEENLTQENAKQALIHINRAANRTTPFAYERERKELLRFLGREQQLRAFYQELILAEYNRKRFVHNTRTTSYIFNKNNAYFGTLSRINDLAKFYNEIQNYERSRYITERLIRYLPPDDNGQPYKTFPREELRRIAAEEYSKRFRNLHRKNEYQELSWDYQDLSDFVESITRLARFQGRR